MPFYRPELPCSAVPSPEALRRGQESGEIFQAMCIKCDEFHNLHVDLGAIRGLIPREEAAMEARSGQEFAILSRVGKPVCFQVLAFDSRGTAILSRRAAQAEAGAYFLSRLQPGDVIPAVVQNPASFGAFCDIGCGFPALMRIARCCISRLPSTAALFHSGQQIYAAVYSVERQSGTLELTGRELLGTWAENAAQFSIGQTVPGIVRSVMPYGLFVELTPNLSGLADFREGFPPGTPVSVFIRSIQPERHKIKLNILEALPAPMPRRAPNYFITEGHLTKWEYHPGSRAVTVF